ncbi:MAG: hypothetical protein M1818_001861 [Claussenomyces sp. TS43310]|nr:MAG: hypothetical protein M1818_001861 [Claussenomyces sp. TS43310]
MQSTLYVQIARQFTKIFGGSLEHVYQDMNLSIKFSLSFAAYRPGLVTKALKAILALVEADKLYAARPVRLSWMSKVEQAFRFMESETTTGQMATEVNQNDLVELNFLKKSRSGHWY